MRRQQVVLRTDVQLVRRQVFQAHRAKQVFKRGLRAVVLAPGGDRRQHLGGTGRERLLSVYSTP